MDRHAPDQARTPPPTPHRTQVRPRRLELAKASVNVWPPFIMASMLGVFDLGPSSSASASSMTIKTSFFGILRGVFVLENVHCFVRDQPLD